MADDGEKTEDATPGRLEEAREKGDVPQSREFANFVIFLGFALVFYFYGQSMLKRAIDLFHKFYDVQWYHIEDIGNFLNLLSYIVKEIFWMLGPLFVVTLIFGAGAFIGQFGFLFTGEKLFPDINKLNPISGFQRLFSKEVVMELVKSILKVAIVGCVVYFMFADEIQRLNQIGAEPLGRSFFYYISVIGRLMFAMLVFMALLGIADLCWQRWAYAERHKMSFQEVKEEMKMREGDPLIRGRIRQMQRERARSRMMDDVKTADVVVANPTHVAVAIKYKRGETKAPIVVAKGANLIAVRIKEIAAQHQIPILEKKALARHLYRFVEVGEMIPESLYTAVAEVLAYVYRVKRKFKGVLAQAAQATGA